MQREHIRSPNPSLQKVDLHLRQARSEAMSAIALVVSKSVSADLVVISAPRVFSIVPCRRTCALSVSECVHRRPRASSRIGREGTAICSGLRPMSAPAPRASDLRGFQGEAAAGVQVVAGGSRFAVAFQAHAVRNRTFGRRDHRVTGHFGLPPNQRRTGNDPPDTAVILRCPGAHCRSAGRKHPDLSRGGALRSWTGGLALPGFGRTGARRGREGPAPPHRRPA